MNIRGTIENQETRKVKMNDKQLPILYTPVQTARILGISRSQVYNLMNSGELNSIHIGRSRRIAQTHVRDFINSLEVAV